MLICTVLIALIVLIPSGKKDEHKPVNSQPKERKTQTVSDTSKTTGNAFALGDNKPDDNPLCNKLDKDVMSEAIGAEVREINSSIKETKVDNMTVSGCSYNVNNDDDSGIRSVTLVLKTYSSDKSAEEAYGVLSKKDAQKLENVGNEAYLLAGGKQAIIRKNRSVITITYNNGSSFTSQPEATQEIVIKL
jgi:hypothetical protein